MEKCLGRSLWNDWKSYLSIRPQSWTQISQAQNHCWGWVRVRCTFMGHVFGFNQSGHQSFYIPCGIQQRDICKGFSLIIWLSYPVCINDHLNINNNHILLRKTLYWTVIYLWLQFSGCFEKDLHHSMIWLRTLERWKIKKTDTLCPETLYCPPLWPLFLFTKTFLSQNNTFTNEI